ncbi:hypothetical protein CLG96_09590 [Sphingomonas oleivorans]|uniref:Uncharacterized protein n=2 Tax=Sphingomonas oleivorans TaxID=1735121 RepID=A0A2T5FYN0_9SPHN|nr:hypothetical protein CLG96_09590 [Sphingomonas oleivorans]
MIDDPVADAFQRLENALTRLESYASTVPAPPPSRLAESYALLEERHKLLQEHVQETIERLDRLIGSEGQS